MALKKKLSKEEFDALPQELKSHYKAQGESFIVDIEGDDGVDWQQKRQIEADHRKAAEARAKKLQDELDDVRRGAIPKDDVAALEKSWQEKLTARETELTGKISLLTGTIEQTTIDSVASEVSQIFLAPQAVVGMVKSRLKTEFVDGRAVTRVLDKNGQPSALTVDDLKNEFKADKSLAPILVGSQASGGGATGNGNGGGAGGKKLNEMNDQERKTLFQTNRAEFDRLVAEQNKSK